MNKKTNIIASIVTVCVIFGAVIFVNKLFAYKKQAEEQSLRISELDRLLKETSEEKNILEESLYREQEKNADFESQINEIASTVGVLDKLAKTDKELLQKYSKVYFLNEHYVPDDLSKIDPDYLVSTKKEEEMNAKVVPFLERMIKEGEEDGVSIRVVSAYRSFKEQTTLKANYTTVYGSGANRFSADQGYSEHQLGTAVDFTTAQLDTNFTQFGETKAYAWLLENAYKFGFVLSYPEGNTYYQYEPWHWRFVGTKLARELHKSGMNFYDMDQRKIDSYLVEMFD